MTRCFIVLAEPEDRSLGVHHTIDGAVHNAAGTMPNGSSIAVKDVAEWMERQPSIALGCQPGDEFDSIRVERHAIGV